MADDDRARFIRNTVDMPNVFVGSRIRKLCESVQHKVVASADLIYGIERAEPACSAGITRLHGFFKLVCVVG